MRFVVSIGEFAESIEFAQKSQVEKAEAVCFYSYKMREKTSFTMSEIISLMVDCGSAVPNSTQLRGKLLKRQSFRADASEKNVLCLTEIGKSSLEKIYGPMMNDDETIQSNGTLLDEGLFCEKRDYLDRFIRQINHCFEDNCFDATAVLMRRLMEISLILAFEAQGYGDQVKDEEGRYLMFNGLAQLAMSGNYIKLPREKSHLEQIRLLGNYSAHGISFTARKKDIEGVRLQYRALLEHLFRLAKLI